MLALLHSEVYFGHPLIASLPLVATHVKVKNAFTTSNILALVIEPAVCIIPASPLENISLPWFCAETTTVPFVLFDADLIWALRRRIGSISLWRGSDRKHYVRAEYVPI